MIGIGVDLCSVSKIQQSIDQNPRFLERYYSPVEKAYLAQKKQAIYQSAAAMYAAKEAFLKALGLGLGAIPMEQMSIAREESGKPYFVLGNLAQEKLLAAGARIAHVSLSHEGDMAIAFVIIE